MCCLQHAAASRSSNVLLIAPPLARLRKITPDQAIDWLRLAWPVIASRHDRTRRVFEGRDIVVICTDISSLLSVIAEWPLPRTSGPALTSFVLTGVAEAVRASSATTTARQLEKCILLVCAKVCNRPIDLVTP